MENGRNCRAEVGGTGPRFCGFGMADPLGRGWEILATASLSLCELC